MTSLRKYFSEQVPEGRHPGPITPAPGNTTLPPFLGDPGLIKREEYDELQVIGHYYAKLFVLGDSDSEDHRYYVWVMDHVANGWFRVMDRVKLPPTPECPQMRVWLEWVQRYTLPPKQLASVQTILRESGVPTPN